MKRNRLPWYVPAGYKHLDVPIGRAFARMAENPQYVSKHSWLPLIKYTKRVKRYKPYQHKTVYKERPIMYCSHKDACILKRYAFTLCNLLDSIYAKNGLDDVVIAYRRLGKSNYHFAAEAFRFAKSVMPCRVLCFDIRGFFDNIDHKILKDRLKRVLAVTSLPDDWYCVFRAVTRYSSIERSQLVDHATFGLRFGQPAKIPICTIAEAKEAGIAIARNPNKFGIPQGTPISSALSNLYLLELDRALVDACSKVGALYRRYSDDILIICKETSELELTGIVEKGLADHRLDVAAEKTERRSFDENSPSVFQYLGFNMSPSGPVIRPGSLARLWRKAKFAIDLIEKVGLEAIATGRADKIFVKKLRRRFSPVGSRNFSSYSRRAGRAFGSKGIAQQVTRFERKVDTAIRSLQLKGLAMERRPPPMTSAGDQLSPSLPYAPPPIPPRRHMPIQRLRRNPKLLHKKGE